MKIGELATATDTAVETTHEVEHLQVSRVDRPVDAGIRKMRPQRRCRRNRMHDVPKGSEPDDQKAVHYVESGGPAAFAEASAPGEGPPLRESSAIRPSRSRVE